ncbi:MAG: hypothetical protein GY822_28325 [Deltaproteobacteria bacterium]|nr:hypothetical protein [Deltaproteobacteria bacterium]
MPFLGLSFTACDDAKTKVEEQKHAPATAKAGTHEDWCEEHSVAESLCTRCHKELSAAFKATGDWCEDHGLPESQCKKCNPDLVITRPPKTAGSK